MSSEMTASDSKESEEEQSCTSSCISVEEVDQESLDDEESSSTSEEQLDNLDLSDAMREYPLFYHHKLNIQNETVHNRVVHELLKFNGENAVYYRQISQHKSALVRIPSASSSSLYRSKLKRKRNFMEEVLAFMGASLNKSSDANAECNSEAAKCILQYLFDNHEEEFRAVAAENNVALRSKKKMEASKVEAMLHESHVGKADSRVLFRHLNQFFGKSMFASEKIRRDCFSGQEFQLVTDVHVLPDKTKVNFWYKLPHEMLKHHARFIFSCEDLLDVSGIDLTVGGDHGKGKIYILLHKSNILAFLFITYLFVAILYFFL